MQPSVMRTRFPVKWQRIKIPAWLNQQPILLTHEHLDIVCFNQLYGRILLSAKSLDQCKTNLCDVINENIRVRYLGRSLQVLSKTVLKRICASFSARTRAHTCTRTTKVHNELSNRPTFGAQADIVYGSR